MGFILNFLDFISIKEVIILLLGFIIVAVSSQQISKFALKIKLPLITGFLVFGIIVGPYGLKLITYKTVESLTFVNDISLAFIALAAGSELYIKELRKNFKSIIWNTFGQFVITFLLSAFITYFLCEIIPFTRNFNVNSKIAISLLFATIFVARSPSSAIAIIDEMRAKGPFTQTALGVTIIKDVLVIILFALCFSFAASLINGNNINIYLLIFLIFGLFLSFIIGYIQGRIFSLLLSLKIQTILKTIIILAFGYSIYILSHYVNHISLQYFKYEIHIEPLLVNITASFYIINYCRNKFEFQKIIQETGPIIYLAFFTLTGAMISIDILLKSWFIALILFSVRLISLIIGAYFGSTMAGDSKLFRKIGWMPFVTQAGVSIALITEIAEKFTGWGNEFATLMITVIVINQIVGPPLFKWSINKVGESNLRAKITGTSKIHKAVIFGIDYQSIALCRELTKHEWNVSFVTMRSNKDEFVNLKADVNLLDEINLTTVKNLNLKGTNAAILMYSDAENYTLCQLLYKNVGIKEIIVRLQKSSYLNKFRKLGVTIVEPSTAVVGLIDHFVRAPKGTSLLLGMESNFDTIDVEVRDQKLHGTALRDLRLPSDILVLSVNRKGQSLVSHGYTRLRKGDIVTLFGSPESLEKIHLKFEVN
ncbi:MAG: potassium transporter TrkA [Chlorobi bacterium]|nr:potassium transporter TrkA [Chlorobiota bacterium]